MGETNASRLRRETPTLREAATRLRVAPVDGSCFMPGNPSTAVAYRPPLRAYRLQRWLPKTTLFAAFSGV